jgi:hypothetical protein
MLNGPCHIHSAFVDGKRVSRHGTPQGQNQPNQGHNNDGGYVPSKGHITAMIQLVLKSNKEEKIITRQVNLAVTSPPATTEYLH